MQQSNTQVLVCNVRFWFTFREWWPRLPLVDLERMLIPDFTIYVTSHHKERITSISTHGQTSMDPMMRPQRPTETQLSLLSPITFSEMIILNGVFVLQTIFTRLEQIFTALTMRGQNAYLHTLVSPSWCSHRHQYGNCISLSQHWPQLLALETKVLNPQLTKYLFSTQFSKMKSSTSYSLQKPTTLSTMTKNGRLD